MTLTATVQVNRFEKEFNSSIIWTDSFDVVVESFSKKESRREAHTEALKKAGQAWGTTRGCWKTTITSEKFSK